MIDRQLLTLPPYKIRKVLPPGLLQTLSMPDHPNQHLTMDFKELPKGKEDYEYILVIVDRFCKDFEAVACCKDTSAADLRQCSIRSGSHGTESPERGQERLLERICA